MRVWQYKWAKGLSSADTDYRLPICSLGRLRFEKMISILYVTCIDLGGSSRSNSMFGIKISNVEFFQLVLVLRFLRTMQFFTNLRGVPFFMHNTQFILAREGNQQWKGSQEEWKIYQVRRNLLFWMDNGVIEIKTEAKAS